MCRGLLIIEVSRSHSDTPQSVGLLWTSDQPDTETSTSQHTTLIRDIRSPGGIRTRNPSKPAVPNPRLRPPDHRHRRFSVISSWKMYFSIVIYLHLLNNCLIYLCFFFVNIRSINFRVKLCLRVLRVQVIFGRGPQNWRDFVRGSVGPERIINGGVIVSGISNDILAASND